MFHPTHLFASLFLLCIAFGRPAGAQSLVQEGPPLSQQFGHSITVLPNGNYIVTDPQWDNGKGAVYLYNGMSHVLISTLTGNTAADAIGNGGVTVLSNGHYVIRSLTWSNGSATRAGAITWGHHTLGVSGVVSPDNSRTGSSANDSVGSGGIVPLPNGNFVVVSPAWNNAGTAKAGAVFLGKANEATAGIVSVSNSLIGGIINDRIGSRGVVVLSNGNYVVVSPAWNKAGAVRAGAVTWGDKTAGVHGLVSDGNSLTGATTADSVGQGGVIALSNGNYVVVTPTWNKTGMNKAGATTWCNGSTGRTGAVTTANSLTGNHANDRIGSGGVYAVKNGNYVVSSPIWDNGSNTDAGAVTFGSGSSVLTGSPINANSLVGTKINDRVGIGGISVLTNGHYVVNSMNWQNGTIAKAGAVTWGDGATGVTGAVAAGNSLVGSRANDSAGSGGVLVLSNGNYVVSSLVWDHGTTLINAGAITWGDGASGSTGSIATSNSIIGTQNYGRIGHGGMTALKNGNYVFMSPFWTNGSLTNAGAVTWCNGTATTTGTVTVENSLIGGKADNQIGSNGIVTLSNGNYVVPNLFWSSGSAINLGAVTWGNGSAGTFGIVSELNSLVGSHNDDQIGSNGVVALLNGNYVVASPYWDKGSITNAGAVTWANGTTGKTGVINTDNSLIGTAANDQVGSGIIIRYPNGDYAIKNPYWKNGTLNNAGAVTFGEGTSYTSGVINDCNSILGLVAEGGPELTPVHNPVANYLLVGKPKENKYQVHVVVANNLAGDGTEDTREILSEPVRFGTFCGPIARVEGNGTNPFSGTLTIKAHKAPETPSFLGMNYVRRYYDIAPAITSDIATARVTLFFSQQDFNDYNTHSSADLALPTGPDDATGKANLRITQHHGTSASGLPGSYSGWTGAGPAIVLLTPESVLWNEVRERWEVLVFTTGFSGFFAHGNTGVPLPVKLEYFTARRTSSKANKLEWATAQEDAGASFEVTRSTDGISFRTLGHIPGTGKNSLYTFHDETPVGGANFYRLRITDYSNEVSYSQVSIVRNQFAGSQIILYPVPAKNELTIINEDISLNGQVLIVSDMQGREVQRVILAPTQTLRISNWMPGIYTVRLPDGTVRKIIKE